MCSDKFDPKINNSIINMHFTPQMQFLLRKRPPASGGLLPDFLPVDPTGGLSPRFLCVESKKILN